jgi:geranylgeranyl pyrophosphate synthase
MMTKEEFKIWFNEEFFAVVEEKSNEFVAYSNDASISAVMLHLSTFIQGGKRLRPYLAYVGYVTEGGEHDATMLFCAIEFLHLFCLVHDDIMDKALTRHEVTSIHEKFDISTAILVGDLLLAWAFECLQAVQEIEPYTIDDVIREFTIVLSEVIHGQMLDVRALKGQSQIQEYIEKKMQLKSAHYSFYRPICLGMLLAGADSEAMDFASAYAVSLGMAFQLKDDLDDWQEDEKTQQQTMVTWYKKSHPNATNREVHQYIENSIDVYTEKSKEAIYEYNKDVDPVWEEIIEEFGIIK